MGELNKRACRAYNNAVLKRSKENCRPAAELCNSRLIGDRLYTIYRMNDVPNKCESCDAFDDCYMIGKGMKEFCKQEEFNAIYKRGVNVDNIKCVHCGKSRVEHAQSTSEKK